MRTALYARTACLTQDLKSAAELQLEALRNYATQNGMEIVEEFTDAGYSGLKRDRPGLKRMCDAARHRSFEVLLTRDAARLARNSVLLVSLLEELEQCGVRTIFPEGPALSKNTLDVSNREEVFAVPFGHVRIPRRDGVAAHLKIDESKAAVVRRIFDVQACGDSGQEESIAAQGCSDELRNPVKESARGICRPHFIPPEKTCSGLHSNQRISYRGGE
jgi:Resolvase, N terminal domain